ncbi:MAG: hypothetical protein ACK55I_50625, partial [bacterium]
ILDPFRGALLRLPPVHRHGLLHGAGRIAVGGGREGLVEMGMGLHQGGEGQGESLRRVGVDIGVGVGEQARDAALPLEDALPHQAVASGRGTGPGGSETAARDGQGGHGVPGRRAGGPRARVSSSRNWPAPARVVAS